MPELGFALLNEHVFGARWPAPDERLEMLEEAVAVMRLLWQGGEQTHRGTHYTVDRAQLFDIPDGGVPSSSPPRSRTRPSSPAASATASSRPRLTRRSSRRSTRRTSRSSGCCMSPTTRTRTRGCSVRTSSGRTRRCRARSARSCLLTR